MTLKCVVFHENQNTNTPWYQGPVSQIFCYVLINHNWRKKIVFGTYWSVI